MAPPPRSGGGWVGAAVTEPAASSLRRDPHLNPPPLRGATAFTQVCESQQWLAGECDRRRASFDRLRVEVFLRATKISPPPELVEGRRAVVQRCVNPVARLRERVRVRA